MFFYEVALIGAKLPPLTYHAARPLAPFSIVRVGVGAGAPRDALILRQVAQPSFETREISATTGAALNAYQRELLGFMARYYSCEIGVCAGLFTTFGGVLDGENATPVSSKNAKIPRENGENSAQNLAQNAGEKSAPAPEPTLFDEAKSRKFRAKKGAKNSPADERNSAPTAANHAQNPVPAAQIIPPAAQTPAPLATQNLAQIPAAATSKFEFDPAATQNLALNSAPNLAPHSPATLAQISAQIPAQIPPQTLPQIPAQTPATLPPLASADFTLPALSELQSQARDFARTHTPALIFGDTGSGKSEIYFSLIAQTLRAGRQALFLMPEISLTPQMTARLTACFGEVVGVWHSKITPAAKCRLLAGLAAGRVRLVAGARSALFLPLDALGLIIVDEEHDESYKSSSAPFYNARDLAVFLGAKFGGGGAAAGTGGAISAGVGVSGANSNLTDNAAGNIALNSNLANNPAQNENPPAEATPSSAPPPLRVVLGSATPSVTSLAKFQTFRLKGSFFGARREFVFDRSPTGLSPTIIAEIAATLAAGKQAVVFLPTRANFRALICRACGEAVKCRYCSVAMSFYRASSRALRCHYCSHTSRAPQRCAHCGSEFFAASKIGTSEVALLLAQRFPQARIAKFDRDEITTQRRLEATLAAFKAHEIDILVGTQMLSKGHDYHSVNLAVILGLDELLGFADFRAREKTLALAIQVAGRAGRSGAAKVVLQSANADFFARFVEDYDAFAADELAAREGLYPPFCRLMRINIAHKDAAACEALQWRLVAQLREHFAVVGRGGDDAVGAGGGDFALNSNLGGVAAAQNLAGSAAKNATGSLAPNAAKNELEIVGFGACAIEFMAGMHRRYVLLRAASHQPLLKAARLANALDIRPAHVKPDIDPFNFS